MVLCKENVHSSTRGGTGAEPRPATYQTRVSEYGGVDRAAGDAALSAYGELYGRVERRLFAEVAAGRSATSLKSADLNRYLIPARMFNGVRVSLEGKVASVKGQQKLRLDSLGRRIARAERQIADARPSVGARPRSTRNDDALVIYKVQAGGAGGRHGGRAG